MGDTFFHVSKHPGIMSRLTEQKQNQACNMCSQLHQLCLDKSFGARKEITRLNINILPNLQVRIRQQSMTVYSEEI